MDECLEALHENVEANLPSHCNLASSCLSQAQTASASDKAPVSEPAAAPQSEAESASPVDSIRHNSSADEAAAAVQEPSAAAISCSNQELDSFPNAHKQQEHSNSSARTQTEVVVAELDWGLDVSNVKPPFEVVLIADVVSSAMSSMASKLWSALCLESIDLRGCTWSAFLSQHEHGIKLRCCPV